MSDVIEFSDAGFDTDVLARMRLYWLIFGLPGVAPAG